MWIGLVSSRVFILFLKHIGILSILVFRIYSSIAASFLELLNRKFR